ncbi:MAG TPA: cyclic nucleotide-binding domain-containing protein [Acidimicrobiia bacterium]|jgi:CRP-like cAMP-binding protein
MEGDVAIERITQMLAAHPFTRDLPAGEIASLAPFGALREFSSGEVIFRADAAADTFYLIRSGLVALEVDTGGSVPRVLQHIAEGSALGWSWLFPPYRWQFTAVARSPVRTIAFDAATLRAHFEAQPQCGYHVLSRVAETMADRLHATRHQVASLAG